MELKFIGILEDVNYTELSESEIFDMFLQNDIYLPIHKYLSNTNKKQNSKILNFPSEYSSELYLYILNPKILEEIYFELFEQIENIDYTKSMEEYYSALIIEINKIITRKDQRRFLKKQVKEMKNYLQNEPSAPLYLGRDTTYLDLESWDELVKLYCRSPYIIKPYLDDSFFSVHDLCFEVECINSWLKLCEIKHSMPIVKNLLNDYGIVEASTKPILIKRIENSVAFLIFTENGFDVFNFFNSIYTGKKNTAFYSYLYLFLRDNNLIIDNYKYDNQPYREYVVENTELEQFKKIQKTDNIKTKRKDQMFSFFKKYYGEYLLITK